MQVNTNIMTETIGYFRWHNLIHDTTKLLGLMTLLDPVEAELFDVDLSKINMDNHAKNYMYGIGKYYNGLDLLPPKDPL